jgi:hypothetical protein
LKTYEPAPTGALDTSGTRIEFLCERIERAPTLDDGILKRTIVECTAMALALARGGREVFPKERVVDMPYTKFTRDKIKRVRSEWPCVAARREDMGNEGRDDRPRG